MFNACYIIVMSATCWFRTVNVKNLVKMSLSMCFGYNGIKKNVLSIRSLHILHNASSRSLSDEWRFLFSLKNCDSLVGDESEVTGPNNDNINHSAYSSDHKKIFLYRCLFAVSLVCMSVWPYVVRECLRDLMIYWPRFTSFSTTRKRSFSTGNMSNIISIDQFTVHTR